MVPPLQWNLWPLVRTGASDTCVVRGSGGGEKLDLILSLPKKHPVAAEVKGLTFELGGLLRAADPSNRPLDPAYPWATGAFIGPGPYGCDPTKEMVRAVKLGDLWAFWSSSGLLALRTYRLYADKERWIWLVLLCRFCCLALYQWRDKSMTNAPVSCCMHQTFIWFPYTGYANLKWSYGHKETLSINLFNKTGSILSPSVSMCGWKEAGL